MPGSVSYMLGLVQSPAMWAVDPPSSPSTRLLSHLGHAPGCKVLGPPAPVLTQTSGRDPEAPWEKHLRQSGNLVLSLISLS